MAGLFGSKTVHFGMSSAIWDEMLSKHDIQANIAIILVYFSASAVSALNENVLCSAQTKKKKRNCRRTRRNNENKHSELILYEREYYIAHATFNLFCFQAVHLTILLWIHFSSRVATNKKKNFSRK